MVYKEARKLVEDLKGRFDQPFDHSDKQLIETLYFEVLRKEFKPTTCQQCYHDALVEIYCYLKKYRKMKTKCNYRLRAGFIIQCPDFYHGKTFTNENLTDKVAREYLTKYPKQEEMFQQIPEEELIENKENADGKKLTGSDENSENKENADNEDE